MNPIAHVMKSMIARNCLCIDEHFCRKPRLRPLPKGSDEATRIRRCSANSRDSDPRDRQLFTICYADEPSRGI